MMTLPTPMAVTKSPRPTEESNLRREGVSKRLACGWLLGRVGDLSIEEGSRWHVNLLGALVVRSAGVLQVAGVFNGDLVTDLGDGTIALLENSLGDTHDGGCA